MIEHEAPYHITESRVQEIGENQFSITHPIEYIDGEARITVGWDEEANQYRAACSPVPCNMAGSHFAFGETQTEALCDLVVSLMSLTEALNNMLNKDTIIDKPAPDNPDKREK
jgi:hypothetical protein